MAKATARNTDCDGCGAFTTTPGKIRRLSLPGNAAIHLCKKCWTREMRWRKERNKILHPTARFPIRAWPGA